MAKMETEISNIKDLLLELKNDIKGLNDTYIPRNELNVMFAQVNRDIDGLRVAISDIKMQANDSKRNIPSWISSIVAIGALAVAFFN